MKLNYFTKIENKYVFNVSLIFWHTIIVLVSLAIIGAIGGLLYSFIPPQKKQLEKPAYPGKEDYPEAIKVDISELKMEDKKDEVPVENEDRPPISPVSRDSSEDVKGKFDYQASLNKLKELIPPSKYSWTGSGDWYYPYGERYWDYYKEEKYRQWIIDEPGIDDKLSSAYKNSKAANYADRKNLLDGYIEFLTPIPEEKRHDALLRLLSNVMDNVSSNRIMCNALVKVVPTMHPESDNKYISLLSNFNLRNPKDGVPFIEYIGTVLGKFDGKQQNGVLERIVSTYYNNFNQNLSYLKEATDSFIQLLSQIDAAIQAKALMHYYKVYLEKNTNREKEITRIENDYEQNIAKIDIEYAEAVAAAESDYMAKSLKKQALKLKSLTGIGSGIMAIVLIATILVFLSIQRSVRKIEEKLTSETIKQTS